MKNIVIFLSIVLVASCSSLSKEECSSLNWEHRAMSDIQKGKNWSESLASYEKACTGHGLPIDRDRYMKGVKKQGAVKCTNFTYFPSAGWKGVGKRDARSGKEFKLKYYAPSCGYYQVELDEAKYKTGFNAGLKIFCTKKSGYEFAKKGGSYQDTCKGRAHKLFMAGQAIGETVREAANAQKEYDQAVSTISNSSSRIRSLNSKMDRISDDIRNLRSDERREKRNLDRRLSDLISDLSRSRDPSRSRDIQNDIASVKAERNNLADRYDNRRDNLEADFRNARTEITRVSEERRSLESRLTSLKTRAMELKVKSDKALKSL